jgi:hypothetical protein
MGIIKNPLWVLTFCTFHLVARAADSSVDWHHLVTQAKPEIQAQWASKYEYGEGVFQDYNRAMYLYCAAAVKGHAEAQYRLGWLYAHGRGTVRDDAMATAWFQLAATQGHAQAKNMFAVIKGDGQKKKPLCLLPREPEPALKPANDRPVVKVSPEERRRIEKLVRRLAPQYGLDPSLVLAVIQVESAFQPQAISPKDAQGLMQLIPATADRFGVQNAMDPLQNLRGGMAYLRWLLAFFQGDVQLALAGYNAGENTVVKYQGIPPYSETQAYVAKIAQLYGNRVHPPVAPVVKPAAMLTSAGYKAALQKNTAKPVTTDAADSSRNKRALPVPVIATIRQSTKKGY